MAKGVIQPNQNKKDKKSKKCGCFPRKRKTGEDSSLLNARLVPNVPPVQQQQQQKQQHRPHPHQQLLEQQQQQQQQLEIQRQHHLLQQQNQFIVEDEKKPLLEELNSHQRLLLNGEGGDVRGAQQQPQLFISSMDSSDSELGQFGQNGQLLMSIPSRAPILSEKDDEEQNDKGFLAMRPPLISLTIFLYAVAYRAAIPVREQYVYGYFAAKSSPFTDDFIMDNKDRSLTCKVRL